MLKNLFHGLREAETYTVRVLDEIVHHCVNNAVEKVEQSGISRSKQTTLLMIATWLGLLADTVYDGNQISGKSPRENAWYPAEIMKTMSIFIPSVIDHFDYLASQTIQKREGTADIHSYNSLGGIFRPYLLSGAIGTVAYGAMNKDYSTMFWGMEAIPWILSFYTRDSQSGGLLQKLATANTTRSMN